MDFGFLASSFYMTNSSLRQAMIRLQRGYFMAPFKKQVLWPPTIKSTYYSTKQYIHICYILLILHLCKVQKLTNKIFTKIAQVCIYERSMYIFCLRHYSSCNIDKPFTILYLQLFVLHIDVFLRSLSFQRNLNHRGCVTSGSNTIIQFIGCATNQPQKLVSISKESFQKRISIHILW